MNEVKRTFTEDESYILQNAVHHHLQKLRHVPKKMQTFPDFDYTKQLLIKVGGNVNGVDQDRTLDPNFSHKEIKAQLYCVIQYMTLPVFSDIKKITDDPKTLPEDKFYFSRMHSKYAKPLYNVYKNLAEVFMSTLNNRQRAVAISIVQKHHGKLTPVAWFDILHL